LERNQITDNARAIQGEIDTEFLLCQLIKFYGDHWFSYRFRELVKTERSDFPSALWHGWYGWYGWYEFGEIGD
jgi:hypothetical protein